MRAFLLPPLALIAFTLAGCASSVVVDAPGTAEHPPSAPSQFVPTSAAEDSALTRATSPSAEQSLGTSTGSR